MTMPLPKEFPYPLEVIGGSYMMIKILELFGGIGSRPLSRKLGGLTYRTPNYWYAVREFPSPTEVSGGAYKVETDIDVLKALGFRPLSR